MGNKEINLTLMYIAYKRLKKNDRQIRRHKSGEQSRSQRRIRRMNAHRPQERHFPAQGQERQMSMEKRQFTAIGKDRQCTVQGQERQFQDFPSQISSRKQDISESWKFRVGPSQDFHNAPEGWRQKSMEEDDLFSEDDHSYSSACSDNNYSTMYM